jgi:hypothetical protein
MTKVRCFLINWDTDDEDVDLPSETTLTVDLSDYTDFEKSDVVCEALSDSFGWCVYSFVWEEVE